VKAIICKTAFISCQSIDQSINQSINQFISLHSTEARATVRLCRIEEKCLETDLKCVNGWSSSTVQWKRVPKSWSSNGETTSSSVQVVQRNWQKLLCGWSQQARLTVWADQISEVAW